jgi:Holliday junction resolvase-like predicted endonuclease
MTLDLNNTIHTFLLVAVIILLLWTGFRIKIWFIRLCLASSRKRGAIGEENAEKWLKKNGFQNIIQPSNQGFSWFVNGKQAGFKIRPDFFAEKDNTHWLIEVKTGKSASIHARNTRRQLREYASLYPDREIALFDAAQQNFYPVDFGSIAGNYPAVSQVSRFKWFVIGSVSAVALMKYLQI